MQKYSFQLGPTPYSQNVMKPDQDGDWVFIDDWKPREDELLATIEQQAKRIAELEADIAAFIKREQERRLNARTILLHGDDPTVPIAREPVADPA